MVLWTPCCFSQIAIVASGTNDYTIGETFPIMQQVVKVEEVSLGVPKFEVPEQPKPKPVTKKKSVIEKLMEFLRKLINKNRNYEK